MKQIEQFICTVFFILFYGNTWTSQEVTSNILQRVFLIKYSDKLGSSFTIDIKDRQYLVTARHLVNGIKDGDVIQLFHENKWKSFNVKPLYTQPPEVDIVVLVLPFEIPGNPVEAVIGGYGVSQNMYFLGFLMVLLSMAVN